MIDEVLWFMPGRDGKRPDDPQVAGEPHRFVRSDMAYLEYSERRRGLLGGLDRLGRRPLLERPRQHGLARHRNVLERFRDRPRGQSPSDE